uniref:Uncharacterized protein n=1 Tax=Anguilla anguilla TaxID=7936 RepID=A0A0E9UQB4_ANGAN
MDKMCQSSSSCVMKHVRSKQVIFKIFF